MERARWSRRDGGRRDGAGEMERVREENINGNS